MLTDDDWRTIGRMIAQEATRAAQEAVRSSAIMGMAARIGTNATLGFAPTRNMTSPNGDAITEAAVWLGVETETATNYIWCPVARGLTLTGGEYVHVTRDSPGSRVWTVDRKL